MDPGCQSDGNVSARLCFPLPHVGLTEPPQGPLQLPRHHARNPEWVPLPALTSRQSAGPPAASAALQAAGSGSISSSSGEARAPGAATTAHGRERAPTGQSPPLTKKIGKPRAMLAICVGNVCPQADTPRACLPLIKCFITARTASHLRPKAAP